MKFQRYFTRESESPYSRINFAKRSSRNRNPDGSIVFELDDIDIPESWSQVAVDIIAQKYFRKAGVPLTDEHGNAGAGRARQPTDRLRKRLPPGVPPPGRLLAPLGRKAPVFRQRTRCPGLLRRTHATCSPPRSPRRIRRSGSTPGSTSPTVSRRRAGSLLCRSDRPTP